MQLSDHIADEIRRAIARLDRQGGLPDSHGVTHGALPLLADLGGCWFIRPDGAFLEIRWDDNEDHPDVMRDTPIAALVVGAERYPWLQELVPLRPLGAVDCDTCSGRGKITVKGVAGEFLCGKCSVLGWIRNA